MAMTWPSIDHSLLSPNGRISKRARAAALKREHVRLFPPGYWESLTARPQPSEQERDLAQAARLEEMADRSMTPRKFRKEAARLRAKWEDKGK